MLELLIKDITVLLELSLSDWEMVMYQVFWACSMNTVTDRSSAASKLTVSCLLAIFA